MKLNSRYILLAVVIILVVTVFLFGKNINKSNIQTTKNLVTQAVPIPTPMPFIEMTIPYLRARTYTSSLGPKQLVSIYSNYTSYLSSYTSDGLKINGLLTIPNGPTPAGGWPAVIFVHGYIPPDQYQTLTRYVDYVDYIARNGYIVFKIDLRGHGDSQGQAGGGYFGSDYVVDTLNAYAALQSADFVNKSEIGLWGHSMAGNILLRSIAAKPDIPAEVIWAGAVYTYTDRAKYGIHDDSYRPQPSDSARQGRQNNVITSYGQPDPNSTFWKEVIPTNYLGDIRGAIQIDHAIDDPVVNIGYSRDLMALLDQTSIPHELNEFPSGGHNIQGASFVPAMQDTINFFDKYLKKQ